MVILELYQNDYSKDLVAFDSIEDGKTFVAQIPGYTLETEDGFEVEFFNPTNLPDYMEIIYNGNIVPLSKFMFDSKENVDIIWKEISNLSEPNEKVIEGYSKIDAYVVNNDEVKTYVEAREANYRQAKDFLEGSGYEVDRSFFGSEDGEAILYRKKGAENWHFLCHLDPMFVEIEDVEGYVKEEVGEIQQSIKVPCEYVPLLVKMSKHCNEGGKKIIECKPLSCLEEKYQSSRS